MARETYKIIINGLDVTLSEKNIHVQDSYQIICPWDIRDFLKTLREYVEEAGIAMDTPLNHRSNFSMKCEWITHNNLYAIGYKMDRTGSVDLNYPQKWYMKVAYFLGSLIVI